MDARGTSPLPVSKPHNVRHCVRHEALLVPGNASTHTSITENIEGLDPQPWTGGKAALGVAVLGPAIEDTNLGHQQATS